VERINLNVPAEVRKRLRKVACRLEVTEAEAARRLLIAAIQRSERDEFYRRVGESQTPASRQRQIEILEAFERLDG
jgi:hypothetical protein